ncbi:MAG TPA: HdeD family acid-resistance protein [Pirellulales bacterium]|jgi:uncharacterized membrane protein HdeD (DUF308 family)
MSSEFSNRPGDFIRHELEALRAEWYWFLVLGVLMIIGGMAAIAHTAVAGAVITVFIGILMIVAGAAQIVGSFWAGKWGGFLITLLAGIIYLIVGGMLLKQPIEGEMALTLVVGAFFLASGIFRSVASMSLKMNHWGWILLNGVVTALLGLLVLSGWPATGLFAIGLFVGIDMLFNGWAYVMLAFGIRSLPLPPTKPATPAT